MVFISLLVYAFYSYLIIGLALGLTLIMKGLSNVDPTTNDPALTFKLIILPGITAFWPFFAKRLINNIKK